MSAALRTQSDIHFRRLLQGLPAAAYTCDREGLITYYNPRAEQLWGVGKQSELTARQALAEVQAKTRS